MVVVVEVLVVVVVVAVVVVIEVQVLVTSPSSTSRGVVVAVVKYGDDFEHTDISIPNLTFYTTSVGFGPAGRQTHFR